MTTPTLQATIYPLFAKPLYSTNIDISELSLDISNIEWIENNPNMTSKNTHVLDSPEFYKIKEMINFLVDDYFYNVMCVDKNVEIYITESWLTKTLKGQYHIRHWHPNSVLSGVLYIQSEGNTGNCRFAYIHDTNFEFNMTEQNIYNARGHSVAPQCGKVILFPSSLEHSVDTYEGEIPRISLSFNTFVKGHICDTRLSSLTVN